MKTQFPYYFSGLCVLVNGGHFSVRSYTLLAKTERTKASFRRVSWHVDTFIRPISDSLSTSEAYEKLSAALTKTSLAKAIKKASSVEQTSAQPRPQGLLAFQYGGGRREDPGTRQKSRD